MQTFDLKTSKDLNKRTIDIKKIQPDFMGYVDTIVHTAGYFEIRGWTLVFDGGKVHLPNRLFAAKNRSVIGTVELTILRPDVNKAYEISGEALKCGFEFKLDEALFPNGLNEFSVIAETNGKQLWVLEKIGGQFLQLELTGKCNLKCPQCPSTSYSKFNNKDLGMEHLPLIQSMMDDIGSGCLDGFGEILLAKRLKDYLASIHYSKHFIFHTNGLLLNEKLAEMILNYAPPIRCICFSLDSLDTEKYKRLRVGGDLNKAIRNIRKFIEIRDARRQSCPRVVINMTLMKDNYGEIEDFVRFAASVDKCFEINFLYDALPLDNSIGPKKAGSNFNYEDQKPKYFAKKANLSIINAKNLAKELGVMISFNGSFDRSPLLEETDSFGYAGIRHPVNECECVDSSRMIFSDGRAQYCVWQTNPIYNWQLTNNMDPRKDRRGIAVRNMIKKGIIPYECDGAGCQWIGLRQTNEDKNSIINKNKKQQYYGGWSGDKNRSDG